MHGFLQSVKSVNTAKKYLSQLEGLGLLTRTKNPT